MLFKKLLFYVFDIYSTNNSITLIFKIDTVSYLKVYLHKLMDQFGLFLTDLLTFRYLVLESKVEMSKWVVTEMLGSAYLIFKSLSVHDLW